MPPKASNGSGKKPTPNRPPSPTNDPPERPALTINKEIALSIILARLDANRDMDWYGLSLDLGAGHAGLGSAGTKEDGAKKRGRKSEEGLTGSVLRDMYYSIILPALKAGKTPWDTTSDIFLSAAPAVEHHHDDQSRTTRTVNTGEKTNPQGRSESKAVPSALTKKDPNVPTAAVPVTPRQPKPRSRDTNNAGTVRRTAIRVYTSASKRRFKHDSSEEEEWSMGSEEV